MIIISPWARALPNQFNPKNPPIEWWRELVSLINEPIIQIGVDSEIKLVPNEYIKFNLTLPALEKLIKYSRTWIAVDSFIQHLAWSLNKPGIVIWGQSNPKIFGHKENINLLKGEEYLMKNQFVKWDMVPYRNDVFVDPQEVIKYLYD